MSLRAAMACALMFSLPKYFAFCQGLTGEGQAVGFVFRIGEDVEAYRVSAGQVIWDAIPEGFVAVGYDYPYVYIAARSITVIQHGPEKDGL